MRLNGQHRVAEYLEPQIEIAEAQLAAGQPIKIPIEMRSECIPEIAKS